MIVIVPARASVVLFHEDLCRRNRNVVTGIRKKRTGGERIHTVLARNAVALLPADVFDGILYMSRITNKECLAVNDRAVARCLEADAPALNSLFSSRCSRGPDIYRDKPTWTV